MYNKSLVKETTLTIEKKPLAQGLEFNILAN